LARGSLSDMVSNSGKPGQRQGAKLTDLVLIWYIRIPFALARIAIGGSVAIIGLLLNRRIYHVYQLEKPDSSEKIRVRFGLPSGWVLSPSNLTDRDVFLESFANSGYEIRAIDASPDTIVDLNIHIELSPLRTGNARENWMLVNQEYFSLSNTDKIDTFLCRHSDGTKLVKNLLPDKRIDTIKFSSLVKNPIPLEEMDFGAFLHAAGRSQYKNTIQVMETWIMNPDLPPLTVTYFNMLAILSVRYEFQKALLYDRARKAENITLITQELSDDDFARLNRIGNVVLPSMAEGYSHVINEARARNQIIITLDQKPMSDLIEDGVSGFTVKGRPFKKTSSGAPLYTFDTDELAETVRRVMKMHEENPARAREMIRQASLGFAADRAELHRTMKSKLEAIGAVPGV
jgi:glycosyltransferase involved in cell wall biosynthesis